MLPDWPLNNKARKNRRQPNKASPPIRNLPIPPPGNAQPKKLSAYCASELIRAQRENQALRNIIGYYFSNCDFDLDIWEKLSPLN